MVWKICSALLLILTISACSLNQAASESIAELSPAPIDTTATFMPTPIVPTATPVASQPTATATFTSTPIQSVAVNSSPSCTVIRTDLPIYTIVAGDTLSSIARKTNSTTAELAQINCLPDASQIAVGQQLRVPQAPSANSPTNTVIDSKPANPSNSPAGVTIIDTKASGDNSIDVSPYLSNEIQNGLGYYSVRKNMPLTLTWSTMPTDLGLTQVVFMYVDDHYTNDHVLIGMDENLADGASIVWTAPDDIQGRIYAAARLPGQYHEGVQSTDILIESFPDRVGPRGAVAVAPNIEAGTPADWSDYVLEPNSTVTIVWSGIDPPEYAKVGRLEFLYYPDSGGIQILGHDNDKNDGMSLTWTVPAEVSGRIQVEASFGSGSFIYSPEIHVRTPDTEVTPCEFNPFGIGGDIPVYGIPNLNTEPIHTIQTGTTYPVLGQGYQTDNAANGLFYHLDFGDFSGWVRSVRGELIGDCSS